MVEFIYKISSLGEVYLYEIIDGRDIYNKKFKDREDMLVWLENNYRFSKLQIILNYIYETKEN